MAIMPISYRYNIYLNISMVDYFEEILVEAEM